MLPVGHSTARYLGSHILLIRVWLARRNSDQIANSTIKFVRLPSDLQSSGHVSFQVSADVDFTALVAKGQIVNDWVCAAHKNVTTFPCVTATATMSDRTTQSDLKLKLKDVVVAVRDVTEWHDLGLQLGLPEHVLKLIEAHPNIEGHRRMMLSKWLESDPQASWEKLIAALMTLRRKDVAENIRRQLLRQNAAALKQDERQLVARNLSAGVEQEKNQRKHYY